MKTSPFPLTEEMRLSLIITIKVEGGARKSVTVIIRYFSFLKVKYVKKELKLFFFLNSNACIAY